MTALSMADRARGLLDPLQDVVLERLPRRGAALRAGFSRTANSENREAPGISPNRLQSGGAVGSNATTRRRPHLLEGLLELALVGSLDAALHGQAPRVNRRPGDARHAGGALRRGEVVA
jgi:hypothetical protein